MLRKSIAPSGKGYAFLLPCKSFALVTREIRAASLSPATNQFFRLLNLSLGLPGPPFAFATPYV